jgi:hypothetical protein
MISMKITWKIFNILFSYYLRIIGGKGMLPNKKDKRDQESDFGLWKKYKAIHKELSRFKYQFNQNPFNICVFASAVLALSEQIGQRLSIRFTVCVAKKMGYITDNGWSYQRAVLKIFNKVGAVPYEKMPDEVGNLTWEEYSGWTPYCEELLVEATKLKISGYKKLRNENAILEALDNGFIVFTASKWYHAMFNPFAPNFFLKMEGGFAGGHAYRITGYRGSGADFETPQTFGPNYGDNGKAWSETTLGTKYYDNWICHFNDKPTLT